jgi:hypothetical protein
LLPLVARHADHWNYSGDDLDEFVRLHARLAELCAAEGRRIEDLTVSANVRPSSEGLERMVERAAAYGEAGADLVSVVMPRPYDPRLLEQIAPVLAPLVGAAAQ